MFPSPYFQDLLKSIRESYGKESGKLIARLCSMFRQVDVDGQIRVLIPRTDREAIGIQELPATVHVSGCGNHLEIKAIG